MLFAATATATAPRSTPPTTPIKLSTAALLQEHHHHHHHQLTATSKMAAAIGWPSASNAYHVTKAKQQLQQSTKQKPKQKSHQQQQEFQEQDKLLQQQQQQQEIAGKSSSGGATVRPAGKSAEIMDAMKKLDANLAALLLAADPVKSNLQKLQLNDLVVVGQDDHADAELERQPRSKIEQFQRVSAVRLQLEALTLQPEGTTRMELLQSEIRPIFTVECQLSNELLKSLPRYDLFHIMQFESEKFHSLTQCTRFGQEAQRAVRLPLNDVVAAHDLKLGNATVNSLGRIHFSVWWREPGTCLNEMLGIGTLDLGELYSAGLLEQCKCIAINRRGQHMASLYLKISLLNKQQQPDDNGFLGVGVGVSDADADKQQNSANEANANNNNNNDSSNNQQNIANVHNDNAVERNNAANPAESNNNPELLVANFATETNKVRLLKGFIYANETRKLKLDSSYTVADDNHQGNISLVCQPFWQQQRIVVAAGANNAFNYQEQFSIINDEKFLKSVDKQHLLLEIQPLNGIVRLPLHQFFIAYRDASITNHLCKLKLPVISIDCWTPIVQRATGNYLGELKCLLAIGSDAQIANLKLTRGFGSNPMASMPTTSPACSLSDSNQSPQRSTTELLDLLQSTLHSPPIPVATAMPFKPHQANKQTFKFALNIASAAGLPLNPGAGSGKGKKSSKRTATHKRFTPNEPPSTYVTFQADDCNAKNYKSHEGVVYATKIVEKSTQPQWQCKFRVSASVEYLTNPQKLFVLKLWKKAAADTPQARQQPTPLDDAIIGFAALNLNLQPSGIHTGGWYNIVDFSGRITGGLEVYMHPLEDVHKLVPHPKPSAAAEAPAAASTSSSSQSAIGNLLVDADADIDNIEQSLDLSHLNLGQAIKRKFHELEQISQRLRTRLVDVTGQQLATRFDVNALNNWETLSVDVDDDIDEDFRRDLKTPPAASPSQPTILLPSVSKADIDDDNNPNE